MTRSPRTRIAAAIAAGALLLLAGTLVSSRWRRDPAWGSTAAGTSRRIVVGELHGPGPGEPGASLADSVVAHLESEPDIEARRGKRLGADADYLLNGVISTTDGRTAIALRLWTGQRSPIWTATFWRQDLSDTALAADLARAVIEALPATR